MVETGHVVCSERKSLIKKIKKTIWNNQWIFTKNKSKISPIIYKW